MPLRWPDDDQQSGGTNRTREHRTSRLRYIRERRLCACVHNRPGAVVQRTDAQPPAIDRNPSASRSPTNGFPRRRDFRIQDDRAEASGVTIESPVPYWMAAQIRTRTAHGRWEPPRSRGCCESACQRNRLLKPYGTILGLSGPDCSDGCKTRATPHNVSA